MQETFIVGRRRAVDESHFEGVSSLSSLLTKLTSMEWKNTDLVVGDTRITPASLVTQVRHALGVARKLQPSDSKLDSLDEALLRDGINVAPFRTALCVILQGRSNLGDIALTGEIGGAAKQIQDTVDDRAAMARRHGSGESLQTTEIVTVK